jgi:hypothetical protein
MMPTYQERTFFSKGIVSEDYLVLENTLELYSKED